MLEKYKKDVELLMTWYERAKQASIEAESLDTVNKAFVQPLHEQRYCLDHFIRAIVYEQNGAEEEKVKKAISSAIGHLQRGYSDSVEWMLVSVIDEYTSMLEPFTTEQINTAFPEYYKTIRSKLDRFTELINEHKINKSVEKASQITEGEAGMLDKATKQFLQEDIVTNLKEYIRLLHEKQSVLLDMQKRDRKTTITDKILFPIIVAAIGAVIGSVLTILLK